MLEIVFGGYFAIWWLIFKKFKLLPINLWTTVTTIFIGMVTVFFGLLLLGRYQPMTNQARTYAINTPIVSEIQGKVLEVTAEGNTLLKKGTALFTIDPSQYKDRVASIQAQLDLAEIKLAQEKRLMDQKAGNKADFDQANSEANRLKADLGVAQYQLDATVVRAPADGYLTQVVVRPGQMVTPVVFNQVMIFIHAEGPYLIAAFSQNEIEFIKENNEAEVAFDIRPGDVYSGKVKMVQPIMANALLRASGQLENFTSLKERDLVPVLFELDQEVKDLKLPVGSSATVSVYTGNARMLNIVRRIILRIKSWENWLPF